MFRVINILQTIMQRFLCQNVKGKYIIIHSFFTSNSVKMGWFFSTYIELYELH